jgi:hypothetical protein
MPMPVPPPQVEKQRYGSETSGNPPIRKDDEIRRSNVSHLTISLVNPLCSRQAKVNESRTRTESDRPSNAVLGFPQEPEQSFCDVKTSRNECPCKVGYHAFTLRCVAYDVRVSQGFSMLLCHDAIAFATIRRKSLHELSFFSRMSFDQHFVLTLAVG